MSILALHLKREILQCHSNGAIGAIEPILNNTRVVPKPHTQTNHASVLLPNLQFLIPSPTLSSIPHATPTQLEVFSIISN
jgi:hypothetical protein